MKTNKMVCPSCGIDFTTLDLRQYEEHKAAYLLHEHGMSYRAISRLFKWTSPESAKVRVETYLRRKDK